MLSTKQALLSTLDKIKGLPVLVVGDIILDRYVWGTVDRISSEAPVPIVEVKRKEERLGGAANVVRNLKNIGAKISLCGFIGDDEEGAMVSSLLDRDGINREGVMIDRDRPTTLKTRIIAHGQQVLRIDREEKVVQSLALREGFAAVIDAQIDASKVVIVADYGKGAISQPVMKKFADARAAKRIGMSIRPLVIDPSPTNYHLYSGICIAKPNRKEAEQGSGIKITSKETAVSAAKILLEKWNAEMMLISLGEDGLVILAKGSDQGIFLKTTAHQVFDVSGAGDTVTALFSAAIATGATPAVAGDLANIAAGIVVSEVGTVPIDLGKLKADIDRVSKST